MTAKLKFTKEEVLQAYSGKNSIAEAARILGCSFTPLTKLMREYGISAKQKWRLGAKQSAIPQLNDRDWLYQQIVVGGRSQRDVAKELDTTSGNVAHYVRRHNLYPKTSQSVAAKTWLQKRYPNGRRGEEAANWRGGRKGGNGSYVQIYKPDHPNAKGGYIAEHRLVMEEIIGRYLRKGEVVDHIDCNKSNNAPDNLRLHASRSAHVRDHFNGRNELGETRTRLAEALEQLAKYQALYGPLPE